MMTLVIFHKSNALIYLKITFLSSRYSYDLCKHIQCSFRNLVCLSVCICPKYSKSKICSGAEDAYGAPAGDDYNYDDAAAHGAPADDAYGAPADDAYGAPAGDDYNYDDAAAPAEYGAPADDGYGAPAGNSPLH